MTLKGYCFDQRIFRPSAIVINITTNKMKRLFLLLLLPLFVGQTGCKKEQDKLEEHIIGSWDLVNHCDEFGTLSFDGNSGRIWVNEACISSGSNDCLYVLPFDWSVDAETGILTIVYDNESSAQLICSVGQSQNNGIQPSTEIVAISTNTTLITLQGWTFELN